MLSLSLSTALDVRCGTPRRAYEQHQLSSRQFIQSVVGFRLRSSWGFADRLFGHGSNGKAACALPNLDLAQTKVSMTMLIMNKPKPMDSCTKTETPKT